MHIRKFDKFYTRRQCLESLGKGVVGAGILMPLFDAWSNTGDIRAAYPDESLDIETYSKGAVKPGGMLDAGNVESVKDLLDPVSYLQIKEQGRVCRIKPTTTDINGLNPIAYNEATARNAGQARLDPKGNVVTADGKPWIGGNPFPNADDPQKICAAHALNWGRHDHSSEPSYMEIVDADGNTQYIYHFLWIDYATVGRTVMDPKPYMPGHEDKLRYVTALTTYPTDHAGSAALSVWNYDQTQFPLLHVYSPTVKRIRRAPSNQRFEPMMPGASMTASDTWGMGDPYMTWGNFKLIGKMPFLGAASGNWNAADPNWMPERVGGKTGRKFFLTTLELIPEAFIVELEPVTYPNAPVGRKRIWFDTRTLQPLATLVYDREGRPWKSYAMGFDVYSKDGQTVSHTYPKSSDVPLWSWCAANFHDLKTGQVSLIAQLKQIAGGYTIAANDPSAYERFCTVAALQQLGGG